MIVGEDQGADVGPGGPQRATPFFLDRPGGVNVQVQSVDARLPLVANDEGAEGGKGRNLLTREVETWVGVNPKQGKGGADSGKTDGADDVGEIPRMRGNRQPPRHEDHQSEAPLSG